MLIDWFTVGAQALNFVILLWLMRHFLYKPILHAIDEREKKIAKQIADAGAEKEEAKKTRDDLQHKRDAFDQERAALLGKATEEAAAERTKLIGEARIAADALTAKRQETLRSDAVALNQAIMSHTQQEVFAVARKALSDLATEGLEERVGAVFTRRLSEMDAATKTSLATAIKTGTEPALIQSAFELPPAQRMIIQNALNETFSADVHVRFETAPHLVAGIELTAGGQKVGWSIAEYLLSLSTKVNMLLKEKPPAAKASPKDGEPVKDAPRPNA